MKPRVFKLAGWWIVSLGIENWVIDFDSWYSAMAYALSYQAVRS